MYKMLWDSSTTGPQFAQVTGITGTGTTTLLADSAVPSAKRVVPVWTVIWVPGTADNTQSNIGLQCSGGAKFFFGAQSKLNYHNLPKHPVLMSFGASFINRGTSGEGLEVIHIIDAGNDASMIVGYYVI